MFDRLHPDSASASSFRLFQLLTEVIYLTHTCTLTDLNVTAFIQMSPSASYVGTTAAASTGLSSAAGALGTTVSEAKRELSYLLDSYNTNTDE